MTWKPQTPRAFALCVVAALAAIVVSFLTSDSATQLVALPFAAFCLLDAGLVAVNLSWSGRVLAMIPVALAICAVILWFSLGMGGVRDGIAAVLALCWGLVLLVLTQYCRRSVKPG